MATKIDTAKKKTVTLDSGQTVVVQELSSMGAFRAANLIRQIIGKARKVGSLDEMLASFRATEEGGDENRLDKLLEAFELLLSVVGDEPELILKLVASCCVDEANKKWTVETIGDLHLSDLIDLMKAVYTVNWVEGSLKKALGKLGMKFEEAGSTSLPATPSEPSEKPQDEKTSTSAEASTS